LRLAALDCQGDVIAIVRFFDRNTDVFVGFSDHLASAILVSPCWCWCFPRHRIASDSHEDSNPTVLDGAKNFIDIVGD
jgi:hypothetical protein